MVVPPDLDWLADVICPQCEGGGEVVPHGDVDCDICVRGEYEGHRIPCPTCGGLGEGLFMPSSLVGSGGRLVVEQPCEHGALEPHGWVCGEHDTDEKCPRRNCEAYLDFGEHCPRLHQKGDACWSASACGGGSRRVVWPAGREER